MMPTRDIFPVKAALPPTMDIRNAPLELQEQAFQKGLIPYVPGKKGANCS